MFNMFVIHMYRKWNKTCTYNRISYIYILCICIYSLYLMYNVLNVNDTDSNV